MEDNGVIILVEEVCPIPNIRVGDHKDSLGAPWFPVTMIDQLVT